MKLDEANALRTENERLRKALLNMMNEFPTRQDAMAQAATALDRRGSVTSNKKETNVKTKNITMPAEVFAAIQTILCDDYDPRIDWDHKGGEEGAAKLQTALQIYEGWERRRSPTRKQRSGD
jgi:hypothetical protein